VLGYHVSLNREYSRNDVVRTIENARALAVVTSKKRNVTSTAG